MRKKILQRITLLFWTVCCSISLAGCARQGVVDNQPMTDDNEIKNVFTDKGLKLIRNTDKLSKNTDISPGYWGIGDEMPDITGTTYDGKKYNLSNTKGKKTVIEFVAYWCTYCQTEESEDMRKILSDNPDITFVQVFADGSKKYKDEKTGKTSDVIQKFYQNSGVEAVPKNRTIVQENHDIVTYAGAKLRINRFPSFYFYDDTGKAAWYHEGILDEKTFSSIRKMVFGKDKSKKLYNCLKNGQSSANEAYHSWEDVRQSTSKEKQSAISALSLNKDSGQKAYYGNLYRPINVQTKMVDLDGKIVDVTESNGTTAYVFLNSADKNLDDEIQVWNQYAKVSGCSNMIAVLIGSNASTAYTKLATKPTTHTVTMSDLPSSLNNIRILGMPEVIYVDEKTKTCLGGYYGEFSMEELQKAEQAMIG